MKNTTICYLTENSKTLMLHRTKKYADPNEGKWIGVGGKMEENESPEECILREFKEETGLELEDPRLCGIVTFVSDTWEGEHMFLFSACRYHGEITDCDEGKLKWIDNDKINLLNLWEGDRIFFDSMNRCRFFTLKLEYEGDRLKSCCKKIYC